MARVGRGKVVWLADSRATVACVPSTINMLHGEALVRGGSSGTVGPLAAKDDTN